MYAERLTRKLVSGVLLLGSAAANAVAAPAVPDPYVASIRLGETGQVFVTVGNLGSAAVASGSAKVSLFVDHWRAADVALPSIASLGSQEINMGVRIHGQRRRILVVVDSFNQLAELDEYANAMSVDIDAPERAGFDLYLTASVFDEDGHLDFTLQNIGNQDSPPNLPVTFNVFNEAGQSMGSFQAPIPALTAVKRECAVRTPETSRPDFPEEWRDCPTTEWRYTVQPPTPIALTGQPQKIRAKIQIPSSADLDTVNNVFEATLRYVTLADVDPDDPNTPYGALFDANNGAVRDLVYWPRESTITPPTIKRYSGWPENIEDPQDYPAKSQFKAALLRLEKGLELPPYFRPPITYRNEAGTPFMASGVAIESYLAHVAHTLWLDIHGADLYGMTWSLGDYSGDALEQVLPLTAYIGLSSNDRNPYDGTYPYRFRRAFMFPPHISTTAACDWNPRITFHFLRSLGVIRTTQAETASALTDWIRVHVLHGGGDYDHETDWGTSWWLPAEKLLYPLWGPNESPGLRKHESTRGCQTTVLWFADLVGSLNIPANANNAELTPPREAWVCGDDECGVGNTRSMVSWAVSSGQDWLIRVGGRNGATGTGTLTIGCQPSGSVASATDEGDVGAIGSEPEGLGIGATGGPAEIVRAAAPKPLGERDALSGGRESTGPLARTVPANDDCDDPIAVADTSTPFDTTGATSEGWDETCGLFDGPKCDGFDADTPDVWFCYTAACDGIATIDLCESGFDTVVGIYHECSCPPGLWTGTGAHRRPELPTAYKLCDGQGQPDCCPEPPCCDEPPCADTPGMVVAHADDLMGGWCREPGYRAVPSSHMWYSFEEAHAILDPPIPVDCVGNECNTEGQQTVYNDQRYVRLLARDYLPKLYLGMRYDDIENETDFLDDYLRGNPTYDGCTNEYVNPYLFDDATNGFERTDFKDALDQVLIDLGDVTLVGGEPTITGDFIKTYGGGTSQPDFDPPVDDNQAPAANAGEDRETLAGSCTTLDGTDSSDPDEGPSTLTYLWTSVTDPDIVLVSPSSAKPTFVAPLEAGDYVFELRVSDGADTSAPDQITVTVEAAGPSAALLAEAVGCRYIGIRPAGNSPVALLVTSPDPELECLAEYVQANGTLGPNPVFRLPAEWCVVYVGDEDIVPAGKNDDPNARDYKVWADYGVGEFSDPVTVAMGPWGDVDGNGYVNLSTDGTYVVDAFAGNYNGRPMYAYDLVGVGQVCPLNRVIAMDDVTAVVNAFTGTPCPCDLPDPDPCDSCSVSAECDDDVDCTLDRCVDGSCVYTPMDDQCPDNGLFCDGEEYCKAGVGCSSTGNPCPQFQTCNEATDTCEPGGPEE